MVYRKALRSAAAGRVYGEAVLESAGGTDSVRSMDDTEVVFPGSNAKDIGATK